MQDICYAKARKPFRGEDKGCYEIIKENRHDTRLHNEAGLISLPICAGECKLQQLYGTVDTLVIGNFCGSVSLAAVGTSSQPVENAAVHFPLGLGTGVSILGIPVFRKRRREKPEERLSQRLFPFYTYAPFRWR